MEADKSLRVDLSMHMKEIYGDAKSNMNRVMDQVESQTTFNYEHKDMSFRDINNSTVKLEHHKLDAKDISPLIPGLQFGISDASPALPQRKDNSKLSKRGMSAHIGRRTNLNNKSSEGKEEL